MAKSIFSAEQETLQELLRQGREEAGLTQIDVAQKLKRPQSFVSKYESGERRLDILELRQVCWVLGVSLKDFVMLLESRLGRLK
jgi:transcriptional regulator with XRE-family HTH domain